MKPSKLATACIAAVLSVCCLSTQAQAQILPDEVSEFAELCELTTNPFTSPTALRCVELCSSIYESQPDRIVECSLSCFDDARAVQFTRVVCVPAAILAIEIIRMAINSDF